MKSKIIFVLALMLLSFSIANAQDSSGVKKSTAAVCKQVAGDKSFEVNFDPGSILVQIREASLICLMVE